MGYKFNIGDRVRVLDGSKIKDYTGGWYMESLIGKEGVITERLSAAYTEIPSYKIKFNDMRYKHYNSYIFDERGLELVKIDINLLFNGYKH